MSATMRKKRNRFEKALRKAYELSRFMYENDDEQEEVWQDIYPELGHLIRTFESANWK